MPELADHRLYPDNVYFSVYQNTFRQRVEKCFIEVSGGALLGEDASQHVRHFFRYLKTLSAKG